MTKRSAAEVAAPMNRRAAGELVFIAALADCAPVGIYHADATGRLTYVNPGYRAILGLSATQDLDDWAQGVHPADRERMQASWADFCRRPCAVQFQWRSQSKSGVVRFLSETVVAVAAAGVEGFVGTITDVTELKETQAEVERLHRQLVDGSRLAGRAEVATSVLHNVGNVLNSVNVSARLVADHVRRSAGTSLTRIASLLQEAEPDLVNFFTADERGRRLPGYVAKLAARVAAEQGKALTELATLQRNIDHIREIVAMQQGYARQGGVSETVLVAELVEESLRLTEAPTRHGVTLDRDFQPVGAIVVDRHRVLPILVNLIRNAEHACGASPRTVKRMVLRVDAGGRGVRISVEDNGIGIAPEHLSRIFTHGFTTKAEGHGFGLHSGALTAKELGGELRVASRGIDRGARFTLDLPRQPPHQHA